MATISERLQYVLSFDTRQAVSALQQVGKAGDSALDESKLDRAAGGMVKYGAAAMATAGVAGMAMWKLAQSASQVEESTNAVNVTFGESAAAIFEIGKTSSKSMGLSSAAFNQAAVGFSSFAQRVAGEGGDVAKTTTDMMTRASDFASVMNIDVNRAMNTFRSAMAGETEAIKQFGIDMSAASVEAYAVANGIDDTGKSMDATQTAMARYGLLMQETEQMAGDFKNTSGSLANSQRILAADIENLKANIGAGLVPMFGVLISTATKVTGVFAGMSVANQKMIGSLAGGGVAILGLAGAMAFTLGNVIKFRKVMAEYPRTMHAMTAAMGVATVAIAAYSLAAWSAANETKSFQDNLEQLAGSTQGQVIDSAEMLLQTWGMFKSQSPVETFREMTQENLASAMVVRDAALANDDLRLRLEGLGLTMRSINFLIDEETAVQARSAVARQEAAAAVDEETAAIQESADTTSQWQAALNDSLASQTQAWEDWADTLMESSEAAQETFDTTVEAAVEWAEGIRGSFVSGAESFHAFTADADTSVQSYIDSLANSNVATQMWEDDLATIYASLTSGTETEKNAYIANLAEMGEAGAPLVDKLANDAAGVNTAFSLFTAGAKDTKDGLLGEFDPVADELERRIRQAGIQMKMEMGLIEIRAGIDAKKIGVAIPDGVIEGVQGGMPALNWQMRLMIAQALAAAKAASESKSPSRLFAREVGAPIAEGIAEGIVETGDKINKSLEQAIDSAADDARDAAQELVDDVAEILDGLWEGIDSARSEADLIERVSDAEESLSDATERVSDAEEKLARIREGGSTQEIADAEKALARAREAESDAAERVADAHDAVAAARANLAKVEDNYWSTAAEKAAATEAVSDALESESDAQTALADAHDASLTAEEKLAAVRSGSPATAKEVQDAEEDLREALESQSDAVERLEDANLALAKAQIAAVDGTPAEIAAWEKIAIAAGLTRDQINLLAQAYRDLSLAKADQTAANTVIQVEEMRANRIRTDFDRVVREGLVGKPELDAINSYANDPAFQLDEMARRINLLEQLFGQPITQYATGGVVSGAGPQLAVVHGGEQVLTPSQQMGGMDPVAWGRMAADAFAKRMQLNTRRA